MERDYLYYIIVQTLNIGDSPSVSMDHMRGRLEFSSRLV